MSNVEDQVFDKYQAARYLGVSVATIKHYLYKDRRLVPFRTQPQTLFTQQELDRFKAIPRPVGRPRNL